MCNFKKLLRIICVIGFYCLSACGGGSGGSGSGSLNLSVSSTTVSPGGSLSATAVFVPTRVGPINGLSVNFTSNRPDLVHFATNVATNTGAASLSQETNAAGSAFVVMNIDNSVAIPATGVDVAISASVDGIPSNLQTIHIEGSGTVVPPGSTTTSISVVSSKATIPSGEQAVLTATMIDSTGAPKSGQTVSFSIAPTGSAATITAINGGVTDSTGKAYATITAGSVASSQNIFINVVSGTASQQLPLVIAPPGTVVTPTTGAANLALTLDKTTLDAPGGLALATVVVTDASSKPVAAQTVTFSTQGSLSVVAPVSVTTGSDGKAYAVIQAGTVTTSSYGFIKAQAVSGSVTLDQTVSVVVAPIAAGGGKPQLKLVLEKAVVDSSVKEVLATATILDPNGVALNNQPVSFSVISGPATIDSGLQTVNTGVDGVAISKVVPGAASFQTNVLVAMKTTYLGVDYSLVATFQIDPAVIVALSFDKPTVNAGEQVIATAKLASKAGAVLAGQTVSFSVAAGPATLSSPALVTVGTDGVATVLITPSTSTTVANVLLSATTTINGTSYTSVGSFMVNPSNVKLELFANGVSVASPDPLGTQVDDNAVVVDGLTAGVNVKAKFSYLDGVPIPGQTITFTALNPGLFWNATGGGTVNGSTVTAQTTTSGEAWAVAVPGNFPTSGYVYIQASTVVNGVTYTQVMPVKVMQTTTSFSFELSKTSVIPNPTNNEITGTVTLLDSQSVPLRNMPVTFSVLSGPATISPATSTTDITGKAMVIITPATPITSVTNVVLNAQAVVNGVTFNRIATFTINPLVSLTLKASVDSIGDNGALTATATLTDSAGNVIPNQPVTFAILAGPATISSGASGNTKTDGTAIVSLATDPVSTSSNVLLKVSTTVNGRLYEQETSFQVKPGVGVLTLSAPKDTTAAMKAGTPPGGTVGWIQTMPFVLTDGNGNPRSNVDVTISVYSSVNATFTIVGPSTITTDAKGAGIVNVQVSGLAIPASGGQNTASVVWMAQTNDATQVTGYASTLYTVTNP